MLWLVAGVAHAQDPRVDFDADGPEQPIQTGVGPLGVWTLGHLGDGQGAVGLTVDYGRAPLVLQSADGPTRVLPHALELQLGGGWAPLDGLEVMASFSAHPVAAYGNAAVGDTRLAVGLSRAVGDWRIGTVPWLRFPTATRERAVGGPGVALGVLGLAAGPVGPLQIAAHAGAGRNPVDAAPVGSDVLVQDLGPATVDVGLAVGRVTPALGGFVEARSVWRPQDRTTGGDAPPANQILEIGLSGQARLAERVRATMGLGTGLTRGPGTAALRGQAAVVVQLGARSVEPGGDEPVVKAKAPVTTCVRLASRGEALVGTAVQVDGEEVLFGSTCLEGRRGRTVDVSAIGYAPTSFTAERHPEDAPYVVSLEPVVVAQGVRVTDRLGRPVEATITAVSGDREVVSTGRSIELEPGTWALTIDADGLGVQERTAVVVPGVVPDELEIVLQPEEGDADIRWTFVDGRGRGVPSAQVLLDGLPLGATGSDGGLGIAALAAGPHELAVLHPEFRELEASVALVDGAASEELVLDALPGTVRIAVTTVGAGRKDPVPVPDAVVRFVGPRRVAPLSLGPDGRGTQVLGPGTWQLVVGSSQGVQQHEVVIGESRQAIDVAVVLRPAEGGPVKLEVRVVDPDGRPLEDVAVLLDGELHGRTSTGGALRLPELLPGLRRLTVASPDHVPPEPALVDLYDEGLMEAVVVLPWKPGTLEVEVRHPDDAPVGDADVRFDGPRTEPPQPLGPTGAKRFALGPGDWSALVASPSVGAQQRVFELAADDTTLTRLEVVFAEEGGLGTLELAVTDPDGEPLDGVEVLIDELPLGTTTQGMLRVDELAVGRRQLTLRAPGFTETTADLRLLEGTTTHDLELSWASTSLLVRVRDPQGGPVRDAVVRALGSSVGQPVPVDAQGDRSLVLTPGDWQVVVASPSMGMGVAAVAVLDEAEGRSVVDVVLERPVPELGEVVLRVVDTYGVPIPVAEVLVDGERHQTIGGGVVLLEGITPGELAIEARAPGHETSTRTVTVQAGNQVRYLELRGLPGWVDVQVRADGAPVPATLTWIGPEDVPVTRVDARGRAGVQVASGPWKVVASAPGRAATRAEVVVEPGMRASATLDLASSRVQVEEREVRLVDVVLFDVGQTELRAEAGPVLDEVANELLRMASVNRVEVQGHADDQGDLALNQRLSQQRAASVRSALVERGVPPELLTARGYGPHRPIADNATAEGRAANRRVEFSVVR
jgi:outer membrane protein OmpA-like peptidoglycan-associated protein